MFSLPLSLSFFSRQNSREQMQSQAFIAPGAMAEAEAEAALLLAEFSV